MEVILNIAYWFCFKHGYIERCTRITEEYQIG